MEDARPETAARFIREQQKEPILGNSLKILLGPVSVPAGRRDNRSSLQQSPGPGPRKVENHYFLRGVPACDAHASIRGSRESPEDRTACYARALIDQVNRGDIEDEEMAEEEPLVEV